MSDSISDEVIRAATIADVLRLANIAPPENEKKPILCPLHAERTPSFHVRDNKVFRCHGCNADGGILELAIALKLAPDKARAIDFLAEHYGIEKSKPNTSKRVRPRTSVPVELVRLTASEPILTAEEHVKLLEAIKDRRSILGTPGERYLKKVRGIEPDAADACGVRFHPNWLGYGEAIIFGGYDKDRNLVAAQGRYLSPSDDEKTRSRGKASFAVFATPGALETARDGLDGPVAIAEAPLDALALACCGLPALGLFGANMRPPWMRGKLAMRDVVIATDHDETGEKTVAELRAWLNSGTSTDRLDVSPAKDPAELLKSDPLALIQRVAEMQCRVRSRYRDDGLNAAA